jgi:hypothetical protein
MVPVTAEAESASVLRPAVKHSATRRQQWRTRLIAGMTILTLLALGGLATAAYLFYRDAASDLVVENDRQVAFLSAVRLKDEMLKFTAELDAVARSRDFSARDPEIQGRALANAANRLKIFDGGAVFMDSFGRVRMTEPARSEFIGNDWSDRDFYRSQLQTPGPFFSNSTTVGPNEPAVIVVSVPVLGENSELTGVLAGMFRLGEPRVSSFYAAIVRLRIGGSGNTYVVDGNGKILYDSGYTRIGQSIPIARYAQADQAGTAEHTRDEENNDIIEAYAGVPGTDWVLITEDDWGIATDSFRRNFSGLVVLLALGMLLPTFGVALLLRGQRAEATALDQAEQEARIMRQIRQRIIPRQLPMLPGWDTAVYYQPTSVVGGNFYDCRLLPNGDLMLFIGDVTERGVPAAHVLATARAALRSSACQVLMPAEAMEHANKLLAPELDPDSAVACLYASLHPPTGSFRYANAGFSSPLLIRAGVVIELEGRDNPLGLSLDVDFHEHEVILQPGDCVAFYSVSLVEVRNSQGATFGLERLKVVLASSQPLAAAVTANLREELLAFNGENWQHDDDVTLFVLEHKISNQPTSPLASAREEAHTPFSADTEIDL